MKINGKNTFENFYNKSYCKFNKFLANFKTKLLTYYNYIKIFINNKESSFYLYYTAYL